jgi:hypothetical protein
VNELISHCVQEEEKLKNEPVKNANVTTTSKNKGKKKRKAADKNKDKGQKNKRMPKTNTGYRIEVGYIFLLQG